MRDFKPVTQKALSACMQNAYRQGLKDPWHAVRVLLLKPEDGGLWMDNEEYTHAKTEYLVKTGMSYPEVAKALERMMKHET